MHRAFFTFTRFVTGSMMEGCPGHLVQQQSVYITPPVAAVSFVTSRHQPSLPSCRRSRFRDRRSRPRRTLSPPATSLVVPTISSMFSSSPPSQNFAMLAKTRWRTSIVYVPSSVYITPPVAAVSFVTSRSRRLVTGFVPGTAGPVPGLVPAGLCRHSPLL